MLSNKNEDIKSQVQCNSEVVSKTNIDIQSKSNADIQSKIDTDEKEAFLFTAKRNAAIMFSKYL